MKTSYHNVRTGLSTIRRPAPCMDLQSPCQVQQQRRRCRPFGDPSQKIRGRQSPFQLSREYQSHTAIQFCVSLPKGRLCCRSVLSSHQISPAFAKVRNNQVGTHPLNSAQVPLLNLAPVQASQNGTSRMTHANSHPCPGHKGLLVPAQDAASQDRVNRTGRLQCCCCCSAGTVPGSPRRFSCFRSASPHRMDPASVPQSHRPSPNPVTSHAYPHSRGARIDAALSSQG